MKARTIGLAVGTVAGVAVFVALAFALSQAAGPLGFDRLGIAAPLAERPARLAWALSAAVVLFAAIALLVATIAGLVETGRVRRRIDALRHDVARADRWNAADWRAAFAETSVADQAEAMIAVIPVDKSEGRRVVVDTPILLGLGRVWLDRLALSGVVAPLPPLLASFAATLALVAYASGERWDVAASAGAAGWFAVALARYLASLALRPAIEAAVAAATAAVRPLSSVQALEVTRSAEPQATPGGRIGHEEAEIIAAALSNVIWEPLGRLAEAAEKLTAAAEPQSRDQTIASALAEIRAGIERLLGDKEDAQPY